MASKTTSRALVFTAVLVSAAALASAQVTAPAASDAPKLTYVEGKLKIDASNVTLGELLTKVTALTGVKIDLPAGADSGRLSIVKLGPGSARDVLAALLAGANFDYLIQASETDPDKLQSVLVLIPDKKSAEPEHSAAPQSIYARAAATVAPLEEPPPAASSNSVAPNSTAADGSAPSAPSAGPPSAIGPADAGALGTAALPDAGAGSRPGALSPPAVLTPQSINQQLQQMYQQRVQITKQAAAPAPANPGGN